MEELIAPGAADMETSVWQRAPDSSHAAPGTQSGQPLELIF